MVNIDLSGAEVKVIGNADDIHLFRLNNPSGESIINVDGEYAADFVSYLGSGPDPVELNTDSVSDGVLSFYLTISTGVYRVRRLNPHRTIMTLNVEVK